MLNINDLVYCTLRTVDIEVQGEIRNEKNLPDQRAFHRELNPNTTSLLCYHMASSLEPLEPNTVNNKQLMRSC